MCAPPWLAAWKPTAKGERAFHRVDIVGELEAEVCLMGDILLKDTVDRRRGEKDDIIAEVVVSGTAGLAMATGLAWLQGHAVTNFQMAYVLSHLNNSAAGFMTENKGWLDNIVADSPVLIIVDVGATDAHVFKFDEHFIVFGLRNRTCCKAHFTNAEHNGNFHVSFHSVMF